jgi:pyruvate,water dikinase
VVTRAVRTARRIALAAGDLLSRGSGSPLARREDIFFFERAELLALLEGALAPGTRARVARRRRAFELDRLRRPPLATDRPSVAPPPLESGPVAGERLLRGIAASGGVARGTARVVRRAADLAQLDAREILVAHAATAELFGALVACAGLVTDVGGMLSHGAILARELGVPAVVATGDASERVRTGDLVSIDGGRGVVVVERAGGNT